MKRKKVTRSVQISDVDFDTDGYALLKYHKSGNFLKLNNVVASHIHKEMSPHEPEKIELTLTIYPSFKKRPRLEKFFKNKAGRKC